ncbi:MULTISPECIES: aliphatic sulfonate ABC transporter substrate-binding protein [Pelosinus]|uniref:Aliphatic sulfonates family ABC transporter, periplasmic ligand-binding protein n=1 Tax=Pelosinus fermentans B4 TaxID=1149862 RepID=I9LES8_9FIRM|nr:MULTISPECIES: aliphatic sulfonate ABC transporter substrate-binding protein [Pelosinus]EIW18969.1 aliphatic sulfonates family ABC transporter, periplasmic ligand-binding protein [Pelosinus fermentans B4]EIW21821.1 aliphatic sulfonates family ABC transporter, periplasmic ligand-binding protein [Pelosinus fermentans A11]OAM95329.1 aliphatic sulfonates family ABC transporter, periplasmic ligand-binding protein [Pelosinus fermentans DSM 17108]SDR26539.1 NitT/TauT family transport system substrat
MKLVKFGVVMALVLAVAGGLSGCSSTTNTAEHKGTKVRVAHFPNITHSQALVGRADGQFQKALGDENPIDWKTFNAGPAEIEALFAGEVDIGYIGPGPAINGYTKSNGDLQIIAGATDAGAILVTRKDLVLKNVGELSGKRVAIPQFGNTQDLSLRHILQENGLKDTTKGGTVEVRQADNPDIKTLLDKGDIDAALVPEPWGARLVSEVKANILLDHKQVWRDGNYTTAVVVANSKFIKEHPDLVGKFLRTHVELTDYINKNPDKAKDTVNSQIKELTGKPLAKEVLDSSFTRLTVTNDPEKESVIGFVKLSVDAGFIKTAPDLKDLFNLTLLNKVLKEKGLQEIGD